MPTSFSYPEGERDARQRSKGDKRQRGEEARYKIYEKLSLFKKINNDKLTSQIAAAEQLKSEASVPSDPLANSGVEIKTTFLIFLVQNNVDLKLDDIAIGKQKEVNILKNAVNIENVVVLL